MDNCQGTVSLSARRRNRGSGKEGFSGKLKESIDAGQRVAVLPDRYRKENPKAQLIHPGEYASSPT